MAANITRNRFTERTIPEDNVLLTGYFGHDLENIQTGVIRHTCGNKLYIIQNCCETKKMVYNRKDMCLPEKSAGSTLTLKAQIKIFPSSKVTRIHTIGASRALWIMAENKYLQNKIGKDVNSVHFFGV